MSHAANDIAHMAHIDKWSFDELLLLWNARPDLRAVIVSRINEIKGAESGGSEPKEDTL